MTIEEIYEVVDRLPPDDLRQLGCYIERKQDERLSDEVIETRIAELHAGLAEFREGLSENQLNDLLQAMSHIRT